MLLSKNYIEVPIAPRGHVLLVSPRTFSYHTSISEALNSIGYTVTWWSDRASSANWFKIALRLLPKMMIIFSERLFQKKIHQLDCSSITHVLVIKGEGLSANILNIMRNSMPSASMGLYLWDGVENTKGVINIMSIFDSIATFDPVDAKKFGWVYRPLFWRKNSAVKKEKHEENFDWCFIGTIHSDRHRIISRLRQNHGQRNRIFVFAYFQSPLILLIRLLSDWSLWFAPKESLSTKPMSAEEVAEKVWCSKSVLDVEHPRQRGFTMRTIETLLAGKKLITTNQHIFSCNLYHPSRVHVISRWQPKIPVGFLGEPFLPIKNELKRYYSCEYWIEELLRLQDQGRQKNSK